MLGISLREFQGRLLKTALGGDCYQGSLQIQLCSRRDVNSRAQALHMLRDQILLDHEWQLDQRSAPQQ